MALHPDPRYVPNPAMDRTDMEAVQREIARTAVFDDDHGLAVGTDGLETVAGEPALVAGIDQAFLDDRVVGAIVVLRGGEVVERAESVTPLDFPYIPGLLSFREGGPILDTFAEVECTPDVAMFDGSGRIHYRQAGLATHMGVALDLPTLGVAKGLLCGRPVADVDALAEGEVVPVEADGEMDTRDGTVVGYAVQTRQYPNSTRVNPVYVSPGHRVSAATARDVALACRGGYKLPEPTRLADAYADEVKRRVREGRQ